MKKLLLVAATLAVATSASAAPGLPEFPSLSLNDFLLPSVRGDHGRDDRRYYDDDRHDRGRHRGHYKRRHRDERPMAPPAPIIPVPVPVLPHHLPTPPLPPGAPRPPGF